MRDVEAVAEADEARGLAGGVDVEDAGQDVRLLRDDADDVPVEPREADDDVLREELGNLEEVAVVDDAVDDFLHLVRDVRVVGDDRVQLVVHPVRVVGRSRQPGGSSRLFCGRKLSSRRMM